MAYLDQVRQQEARSFATFHADSRSDADDAQKRQALEDLNASTAYLRTVGDLLVAAFFNGKKPKDREELKKLYLEATLQHNTAAELEDELAEPLERLREGKKGIQPLHWQLAFPDVFGRQEPGFDVFVGNPPFIGGKRISTVAGDAFKEWLQEISVEGNANADLVAHFFRRCFQLLRPGGSLGLIATNTIAQGDTRSTGLRWICLNGGTIYAARKRYEWPGVAAVVVSVVHLLKGAYAGVKLLEKLPVEQITAFLFADGGHEDPKLLAANAGKSFIGSIVLGMGFTFDDSGPADDETPGIPSPIATMQRLIAENQKNTEVIFPYIGGEEVNSSPAHAHHRHVINFGERSEEECWRDWPELMEIVEQKVKPERIGKPGSYSKQWWLFGRRNQACTAAIAGCERVLAISRVTNYRLFSFLPSGSIFAEITVFFPLCGAGILASIQSRTHEAWALFMSSSLEERLRYGPTDCFENFPLALLESTANDPAHELTRQSLETIGERYHEFRAELMMANNEGLTSTYIRFHDPSESSSGLLELRRLHGEMDQAVLNAYGWIDVLQVGPGNSPCGFGLDYLDLEEDAQLPDDLQDRIDSGELFFWEPDEACAFEAQVRAYGAVKGKKKLPWRYRWPDDVRDDVLARLLALNAERYAEEVALGLHGKGGKQGAKASKTDGAAGGKRRGRPAKASQVGETGDDHSEQMGLVL
jgi:hypothetical protein